MLAQRAQQFRSIQRRLLTRFKDKTPAPLSNLDTLLDGTYRQVFNNNNNNNNNNNKDKTSASLSNQVTLLDGTF